MGGGAPQEGPSDEGVSSGEGGALAHKRSSCWTLFWTPECDVLALVALLVAEHKIVKKEAV